MGAAAAREEVERGHPAVVGDGRVRAPFLQEDARRLGVEPVRLLVWLLGWVGWSG